MSWNEFWPMITQVLITAVVLSVVLLLAGVTLGGVIAILRTAFGRGPVKETKAKSAPSFAAGGLVSGPGSTQHHG